jgi:hypothetical protein
MKATAYKGKRLMQLAMIACVGIMAVCGVLLITNGPSAGASTQSGTHGNLTFTSTGTVVTITGARIASIPAGSANWSVVIPREINGLPVVAIGANAFNSGNSITDAQRNRLNSITFESPSNVHTIDRLAFANVTGVATLALPDSLETIRNNAFQNMTSLTAIGIPRNVHTISFGILERATQNITLSVAPENTHFQILGGAIVRTADMVLVQGTRNSTIEQGVREIGQNAFSWISTVTNVTIPSSVTTIGRDAFQQVGNITLNLSNATSLTRIEDGAFAWANFPNITIPASVTHLGQAALRNNTLMTSLHIHAGITSVGSALLIGNTAITTITVDPANPVYRSEGNTIIRRSDNFIIAGCRGSTIAESVIGVTASSFRYIFVASSDTAPSGIPMTIPGSLGIIENIAFHSNPFTFTTETSRDLSGWINNWQVGRPVARETLGIRTVNFDYNGMVVGTQRTNMEVAHERRGGLVVPNARGGYTFGGWFNTKVNADNLSSEVGRVTNETGLLHQAALSGYIDSQGRWTTATTPVTVFARWTKEFEYSFTGQGTAESPFMITTANQLHEMRDIINNGVDPQTYNNRNAHWQLGANIYLNDTSNWKNWSTTVAPANQWAMFGVGTNLGNRFGANFNGNGFVVRGVYINSPLSNIAFFGPLVGGATIRNFGLEQGFISGISAASLYSSAGTNDAEGVARPVLIDNCYSTLNIHTSNGNGAGGLALSPGVSSTIRNSFFAGTLEANLANGATISVGGIVANSSASTIIENSFNAGQITVNHTCPTAATTHVGGIIGSLAAVNVTVRNTLNTGAITINHSGFTRAVGGIVGNMTQTDSTIIHSRALRGIGADQIIGIQLAGTINNNSMFNAGDGVAALGLLNTWVNNNNQNNLYEPWVISDGLPSLTADVFKTGEILLQIALDKAALLQQRHFSTGWAQLTSAVALANNDGIPLADRAGNILNAIANLQFTNLAPIQNDYSVASFAAYTGARSDFEPIMRNTVSDYTLFLAAANRLNTTPLVDIVQLRQAIDFANSRVPANFTVVSLGVMNAERDSAVIIMAGALTQTAVDEARADLQTAIDGLINVQALQVQLGNAEPFLSKASLFTPSHQSAWNAFTGARTTALNFIQTGTDASLLPGITSTLGSAITTLADIEREIERSNAHGYLESLITEVDYLLDGTGTRCFTDYSALSRYEINELVANELAAMRVALDAGDNPTLMLGMADAIQEALDAMVYVRDLVEARASANTHLSRPVTDFTVSTRGSLQSLFNSTGTLVNNALSRPQVEAQLQLLSNAIDTLVEIKALNESWEEATAVDLDTLTNASRRLFEEALDYNHIFMTQFGTQHQVDTRLGLLLGALLFKDDVSNVDALSDRVDVIKGELVGLDSYNYTTVSWQNLQTAIANADSVITNRENQATINSTLAALNTARTNLRSVVIAGENLRDIITIAEGVNTYYLTTSTADALIAALATANAIVNHATSTPLVISAHSELTTALENMIDIGELRMLVDAITLLNHNDFTSITWGSLMGVVPGLTDPIWVTGTDSVIILRTAAVRTELMRLDFRLRTQLEEFLDSMQTNRAYFVEDENLERDWDNPYLFIINNSLVQSLNTMNNKLALNGVWNETSWNTWIGLNLEGIQENMGFVQSARDAFTLRSERLTNLMAVYQVNEELYHPGDFEEVMRKIKEELGISILLGRVVPGVGYPYLTETETQQGIDWLMEIRYRPEASIIGIIEFRKNINNGPIDFVFANGAVINKNENYYFGHDYGVGTPNGNLFITGIMPGTTILQLKSLIAPNIHMFVFANATATDPITDFNLALRTGMVIRLIDDEDEVVDEVTIVVMGNIVSATGSVVTAMDAVFVLRSTVGLQTLTEAQSLAARVLGRNFVNAMDASRILRYTAFLDDFAEFAFPEQDGEPDVDGDL